MNLCSSVIRLDQYPERACFNGSGFPTPSKGLRLVSLRKDNALNILTFFLSYCIYIGHIERDLL